MLTRAVPRSEYSRSAVSRMRSRVLVPARGAVAARVTPQWSRLLERSFKSQDRSWHAARHYLPRDVPRTRGSGSGRGPGRAGDAAQREQAAGGVAGDEPFAVDLHRL